MNELEEEKFNILMKTADRGFSGPLQFTLSRGRGISIYAEYSTDQDPNPYKLSKIQRDAVKSLIEDGTLAPTYNFRYYHDEERQAIQPTHLVDWIEIDDQLHVIQFGSPKYNTPDRIIEIDQTLPAITKVLKPGIGKYYPYGRTIDLPEGKRGWLVLANKRDIDHYNRFAVGTSSPGRPVAFMGTYISNATSEPN